MLRPSAFAVDQEAEWSDPNEATSLKYVPTRGSLNKQVPGLTTSVTHTVPPPSAGRERGGARGVA